MEIVSCPKCGRPRALGHRCPSCGDAATAADVQSAAPNDVDPWRQAADPLLGGEKPAQASAAQAGSPAYPASTVYERPVSTPPGHPSGRKRSRGFLATIIAAVMVIAVVVVVAVVLTTGGSAVIEESAAVASAPQKAYDQAAQSLLRNAMTVMDSAFTESADYTAITQDLLQMIEPSIAWVPARSGVCASPPTGAQAQGNSVAWAGTGRLSYELGTWSASGTEFGVKVNRAGGGTTHYRAGAESAW